MDLQAMVKRLVAAGQPQLLLAGTAGMLGAAEMTLAGQTLSQRLASSDSAGRRDDAAPWI